MIDNHVKNIIKLVDLCELNEEELIDFSIFYGRHASETYDKITFFLIVSKYFKLGLEEILEFSENFTSNDDHNNRENDNKE